MKRLLTNRANTASASASNTKPPKRHILFLHGSFHGPWCWDRVIEALDLEDTRLEALDLPAADSSVDLSAHIERACQALNAVPARTELVLIAHSYGGMVMTGATRKARRKPEQIILIDAFFPDKGESAFDLLGPMAQQLRSTAVDGCMPAPDPAVFGITDPTDQAWVAPLLQPMSLATHDQPCPADAANIPTEMAHCVYIRCTGFPGFADAATRAKEADWTVLTIDAGHDVMITDPVALADMIKTQLGKTPR